MMMAMLEKLDQLDYQICRTFNQALQWSSVHRFFGLISRLGDGPVWYVLMITLPIMAWLTNTTEGYYASGSLLVSGLAGLMLYRFLKDRLARERPFIAYHDIDCRHQPLDRYSFPSGHTLHAVMFTTITVAWFPIMGIVLVPLTSLIALSRLVLGLHYPTDVIVGAFIGFGLAQYMLILLPPLS